jgi:hypothetical protein
MYLPEIAEEHHPLTGAPFPWPMADLMLCYCSIETPSATISLSANPTSRKDDTGKIRAALYSRTRRAAILQHGRLMGRDERQEDCASPFSKSALCFPLSEGGLSNPELDLKASCTCRVNGWGMQRAAMPSYARSTGVAGH